MTDPVKYTIGFSFSVYQAVNPADPIPAEDLDEELIAIQTSIGESVDAITSIRRADGNLQNGIVSWDGLNDDLKDRINNSGDRVTIADIAATAYASQTEAETGVANDRLMTPLRTQQAVDSYRAFASQSEAQTGTDTVKVMSSARTKDAIDAQRAFASQAEAQAGTEAAKVSSPLRVTEQLDALRKANTATASLTWGSIAAGASAEQTIAVSGAVTGERALIGLPAAGLASGLIAEAWVSAANQVKLRITNTTAGALTPNSGVATDYAVTAIGF